MKSYVWKTSHAIHIRLPLLTAAAASPTSSAAVTVSSSLPDVASTSSSSSSSSSSSQTKSGSSDDPALTYPYASGRIGRVKLSTKEARYLQQQYYQRNGYVSNEGEPARMMDANGVTFPASMHTLILAPEANVATVQSESDDPGRPIYKTIKIDWSTLHIPASLRSLIIDVINHWMD